MIILRYSRLNFLLLEYPMSLSTNYSKSLSQPDLTVLDLPNLNVDAHAVLSFWFHKDHEQHWFIQDDDFDKQIKDEFGEIWRAAKQGECAPWRYRDRESSARNDIGSDNLMTSLAGRLAEIIVLDQFSRNLCRNKACAFTHDGMALVLAQEAVNQPRFNDLPSQWRTFMIMPFMHSESMTIHKRYLTLFEQLEDSNTLEFEHKHQAIIKQFGRYPHRNEVLNRESSDAEKEFLRQPNSSF